MSAKLQWRGTITSVQPRIRLLRSFDERSHSYLGYVLQLDGEVGGERRRFTVAIGKAVQAKHEFQVGFEVSGEAVPVPDPRRVRGMRCRAQLAATRSTAGLGRIDYTRLRPIP